MKTLLLVRHAKSSWDQPGLADFDRPLNARGKADAPDMARRLADRKMEVDIFISSPARRARKTAELFIRELDPKNPDIMIFPGLYEATEKIYYDLLLGLDKEFGTVALFAHNPGITDFANTLTEMRLDNIPTCGIFALTIAVDNWRDFGAAGKQFLFFDYPKAE